MCWSRIWDENIHQVKQTGQEVQMSSRQRVTEGTWWPKARVQPAKPFMALLGESKLSPSWDEQPNFLLGIKMKVVFPTIFCSASFFWVFFTFLPFPEIKAMTARQSLAILWVSDHSWHELFTAFSPAESVPGGFCVCEALYYKHQGIIIYSCALSLQDPVPRHFIIITLVFACSLVYNSSENSSFPFDVPLHGALFYFSSFFRAEAEETQFKQGAESSQSTVFIKSGLPSVFLQLSPAPSPKPGC